MDIGAVANGLLEWVKTHHAWEKAGLLITIGAVGYATLRRRYSSRSGNRELPYTVPEEKKDSNYSL